MKCKEAKKLIMDFLCDELPSQDISELQEHLEECGDCLEYKEEMQQTIKCIKDNEAQISTDLLALNESPINNKRFRIWKTPARPWPIWVAAAVCACSVLFFALAFLATEVQYTDNVLTIRFRGAPQEQKIDSELRSELLAEMNSMYQRTANILEEYKKGQAQFESRIVQELRDYGDTVSQTIKLLSDHESQKDKQIILAIQQLQLRQNQIFDTVQRDLDTLAIETQREFERNYKAMATVTELVASGSY